MFKKFDNVVLNSNFFEDRINWSYDKWNGFFIWWCPNKLFDFVYNFFLEYHKKYDKLINYFLIDYAIHIAYNNLDDCKKYIDNISLHKDIFLLVKNFNKKYIKNEYDQLMDNWFYKLTWKLRFNEFISDWENKYMTNYWKFLHQNKLNEKN